MIDPKPTIYDQTSSVEPPATTSCCQVEYSLSSSLWAGFLGLAGALVLAQVLPPIYRWVRHRAWLEREQAKQGDGSPYR